MNCGLEGNVTLTLGDSERGGGLDGVLVTRDVVGGGTTVEGGGCDGD